MAISRNSACGGSFKRVPAKTRPKSWNLSTNQVLLPGAIVASLPSRKRRVHTAAAAERDPRVEKMPRKGLVDVRRASTLLYLASVGFAAAASVSLFVIASLSLYGSNIPTHAGFLNSTSPGGGKFGDTAVRRLSDHNIALSRQAEWPTSLGGRGLQSDASAPPSANLSRKATWPETASEPDNDNGSSTASMTQDVPPLERMIGKMYSDDVTRSQELAKAIGDEAGAGIDAVSKAPIPFSEISAPEPNPIFRDLEIQRAELQKMDEGGATPHDEKLGQQSGNRRSDDHFGGLRADFRYRVKRECGPIHDRALYRDCVASFRIYRH